ncbi:hypothetical protein Caci_2926 [Catenulispora acidiphila DSM 44928]|uniref:DUF6292 domain-containing protein n=1 Tax=Catenulispora acidiphila (strain DSM 44928 / JCM 14897 / NBRC 102108 / NRRL B-24433 / ID139908) TaxID=479433 RepID=C7Q2U3_CATAD|nr:DUF6292 family protein [Catenulispora acidiphila]ACU71835.1 hypothetical protein Caci_2926 [Catenulispora acidiphila DSM 44928]
MFVKPMPHDGYINEVAYQLTQLGHEPTQQWTTSPDGEQLDGVIVFDDADPALWPDHVWLGWDQHNGWALCDNGTRALFPLDLDVYAAPGAVAVRAADRLTGRQDTDVDEDWDGAAALAEAVRAWEKEGAL